MLFDWARAWHSLGQHEEISAEYLEALEGVTRAVTNRREVEARDERGRIDSKRVVQMRAERSGKLLKLPLLERLALGNRIHASQLLRLRVNDGAFGETREFRQFDVGPRSLRQVMLPGTPTELHFQKGTKENAKVAKWLRQASTAGAKVNLLRDHPGGGMHSGFSVPVNLMAMVAPVPNNNASYHWDGEHIDRRLRHRFSMQTCCGCHGGDTGTEFFHIPPRQKGEETKLSAFLRRDGKTSWVKDPAGYSDIRLNEMAVRKKAFQKLLREAERKGNK